MTDIPLPSPGDRDWQDWAAEQEELSDAAREIVSGRLTDAALRAAFVPADPVLSDFVYDGATGNLTSYKEDGVTITLTYNADGTVATSKRGSAATKTYSYSGGNLAGVA